MRKESIYVAMMMVILTATTSFGAVSDYVYVRKDVFDAKMETLFNRLHAEIGELRGDIKALSERIDRNFDTLSARMNGLDKRMDDQQHYLYLMLVLLGIIVALPAGQKMLQWHEERKDARKASITLEDVKRLIEENNARMTGKVQV